MFTCDMLKNAAEITCNTLGAENVRDQLTTKLMNLRVTSTLVPIETNIRKEHLKLMFEVYF